MGPPAQSVDFQLHSLVLELERERHASAGMKKKVADLGDMNTKLGLTVSKQQQLIDAHAKDAEALERKWRRKCEGLTRQLRELQTALDHTAADDKKARKEAKKMKGQLQRQSNLQKQRAVAAKSSAVAADNPTQMVAMQKGFARQRDRGDQLEVKLKHVIGQLREEKGARAKSDKLVHELWDKLKDVEGEGKANLAKTAQERRELTHAKQKLQQEVSVLRQAVTGKQKVANKNARAASVAPASRELQAAQTKMQQYRDRGEALRLELDKVKTELRREKARASSAEKALAKALQEAGKLREAASGGVQQSSVARTERREAELRAEKSEKAVRRLAEKNKQLHAAVAEREKEIAELRRAAEKKERFVGVKKAVYVPEVKDDDGIPGLDSDEDDDDDDEVAEVVEEEEEDGDEEEDDSSDEESD